MKDDTFYFLHPFSEKYILDQLQKSPITYKHFTSMEASWRKRFLDFCEGKTSLPLTYDPFFKRIFHPDIHPDRLSRLISSLLGINIRVLQILPNEDTIMDGNSLLIMDVLVETEEGMLINVEIQKQAYAFPAQRISCYSADLLLRQYARVRGEKGKYFTYKDIKKVYVIVILEKNTSMLNQFPDHYIHYGKTLFNTGLPLELLQEYCLVTLDVFQKIPYAERNKCEQTAWLSLLVTESMEDVVQLLKDYPWLEEIYQEIAQLRQNPEEVLSMFSKALKILDDNTVKYMIDEKDAEIEKLNTALANKDAALANKDAEIERLRKMLTDTRRDDHESDHRIQL